MKKTLAALAGALVALPVLAAGPQGFAAAPQAQGPKGFDTEPARVTRDQRGRNQGEKNIDARKAERAEHDDRYDDRIEDEFHGWTSFSILSSVRIPLPADALGGRWRPFAGHTRSIMTQPATIPHIPKDVFS